MVKPPIIVVDRGGDVYIFSTVEKAESYLEPIDVRHDEYTAYDSEGRLLRLTVELKKVLLYSILPIPPGERVVVQSAEDAPTHAAELRDRLAAYMARIGEAPDWLAQASLDEMVRKGVDKYQTA